MRRAVGAVAAGVGFALRFLLWWIAQIPLVAGPVLLWFGLFKSPWPWASWVALGLILTVASAWPTKKGAK